jgi:hypothetical protein
MRILKTAVVGPGFARPRMLLGHGDKIYVAASCHEVCERQVSAGPEPGGAQSFEIEVSKTLGRCKPAISDVAREAGFSGRGSAVRTPL